MIPQLAGALGAGFTTKQVMQYLIRQFPQHSDKIKKALTAGYSVDQIIKFLSGGRKAINEESQGLTEHEQTRNKDIQRRENVNQRALQGAGAGALAIGGSLVAPMAMQALQRAAPQLVGPSAITNMPGATQTAMPPNQAQLPTLGTPSPNPQQPPVSPVSPTLPQSAQPIQPQVISNNIGEIFSKYPLLKAEVDKTKDKNPPEAIAALLRKFNAKDAKSLEKETGKPIEEIIYEYVNEMAPQKGADVKPALQPEIPEEKKPLSREEALGKFRDKIIATHEKGHTVVSPQGIGEIKEIRNGKAIIEIDGKKHQVDEDELESSPLPEKDLADLLDDLLKGIESETGEDVSRMVQWAGYNPENNTLTFLPHTGKLYKYGNISSEDAALLTDILSTRKTSGSNFIGAWKAGSKSPIGAALSQLIRKLQSERGGKGNEYEETHEPIYSAYEPAIEAKKRKRKKK